MSKKNILIIGGSSSIGECVVNKFFNSGYDVISTYSSNIITSNKVFKNLQLDLTSEQSMNSFARELKTTKSSIDSVVFLSGILLGKSLENYSLDEINKVFAINVVGQAKIISKLYSMLGNGSNILMMSSISAQRGSFDPIYASSKAAILGFIKSMADKLPKGSRINAIAPGLIDGSSMCEEMTTERQDFHKNKIHSGKLLSKLDLANVIYDLCQDHWTHLNGACIDLNGGQNVR
jgi:3-oxoacyl-[acyl-carrier protein] reductase